MPDYSSYTYKHPSMFVRYPHVTRNRLVSKQITRMNPLSWLDYGAGDGALLRFIRERGNLPGDVVCYEPDDSMDAQLAMTLESLDLHESAVTTVKNYEDIPDQKFTLITALEVLEHLPLPERYKFYCTVAARLDEDGTCLIELPVEYGPMLLLKETGRIVLKRRQSPYTAKELIRATLSGQVTDSLSRFDPYDSRVVIGPHYGFCLKKLIEEISSLGRIERLLCSPFQFLPPWANQVVLYAFKPTLRNRTEIARKLGCEHLCK